MKRDDVIKDILKRYEGQGAFYVDPRERMLLKAAFTEKEANRLVYLRAITRMELRPKEHSETDDVLVDRLTIYPTEEDPTIPPPCVRGLWGEPDDLSPV